MKKLITLTPLAPLATSDELSAIRSNGMEHLFQFAFDIAAHSFHAGCKDGKGQNACYRDLPTDGFLRNDHQHCRYDQRKH